MNNVIEKSKREHDKFGSTLDPAREDCNAAFQAHDRLSDENADLNRRIKDLEDRQRSNEDLKQRFEDLQRRSHSLSHTSPAKSNPTNDSSSSESTKSVASHSRPPDLDDSVSPPNILPSKNAATKTTPEIQRLRDKRDHKASKFNASLKTVTTVKSPNTSPNTTKCFGILNGLSWYDYCVKNDSFRVSYLLSWFCVFPWLNLIV